VTEFLREVLKNSTKTTFRRTNECGSQLHEEAWRQDQHKSVFQTKNFSLDAGALKSQNGNVKLSRAAKGVIYTHRGLINIT